MQRRLHPADIKDAAGLASHRTNIGLHGMTLMNGGFNRCSVLTVDLARMLPNGFRIGCGVRRWQGERRHRRHHLLIDGQLSDDLEATEALQIVSLQMRTQFSSQRTPSVPASMPG